MDAKSGTSDEDIFDEFDDEEENGNQGDPKTNGKGLDVEDEDDEMDYSD